MKTIVYSLTTDGDNMPIETAVYATLEQCRRAIIQTLDMEGIERCGETDLCAAATPDLCELWTETFNGVCSVERHAIEAIETEA